MESAKTSAPKEPTFILKVGGEELNLKDYPPITQGDKKKVKLEPYKLNMKEMEKWEEAEESLFALFLLKRVRENTTLVEVDALPAKTIQDLVAHCMRSSARVENPFFSMPSPSSGASSAGG